MGKNRLSLSSDDDESAEASNEKYGKIELDGQCMPSKQRPTLRDYVNIARLDHSTKHIFIVPGIVFAMLLRGVQVDNVWVHVTLGFITAVCIASANYTINEWLDRDFDKHHPEKSARTAVQVDLGRSLVLLQWGVFVLFGLGCALLSSSVMFWVACVFAAQGVVYNVPPLRTKDIPFVDVISESINNPLRLMIGWAMIDPGSLPPSSILAFYWLGGAFLMAAKRLSEYRQITASHGKELLASYRKSFGRYSETTLTASCFAYAMLSAFFLGVFLVKYRVEYVLTLPLFAALFTQYMILALQSGTAAQKPEKLFSEKRLMVLLIALVAIFALCTFVDMPILEEYTVAKYITLG